VDNRQLDGVAKHVTRKITKKFTRLQCWNTAFYSQDIFDWLIVWLIDSIQAWSRSGVTCWNAQFHFASVSATVRSITNRSLSHSDLFCRSVCQHLLALHCRRLTVMFTLQFCRIEMQPVWFCTARKLSVVVVMSDFYIYSAIIDRRMQRHWRTVVWGRDRLSGRCQNGVWLKGQYLESVFQLCICSASDSGDMSERKRILQRQPLVYHTLYHGYTSGGGGLKMREWEMQKYRIFSCPKKQVGCSQHYCTQSLAERVSSRYIRQCITPSDCVYENYHALSRFSRHRWTARYRSVGPTKVG